MKRENQIKLIQAIKDGAISKSQIAKFEDIFFIHDSEPKALLVYDNAVWDIVQGNVNEEMTIKLSIQEHLFLSRFVGSMAINEWKQLRLFDDEISTISNEDRQEILKTMADETKR